MFVVAPDVADLLGWCRASAADRYSVEKLQEVSG